VHAQSCDLNPHFRAWFRRARKKTNAVMKPFSVPVVVVSRSTHSFSKQNQLETLKMTFFKMAAATAVLALMPMTAMAAEMPTAEQCDAWFVKVDSNKDGALGQQEDASKYAGMISGSSVADKNSSTSADALILTKEIFMTECGKGTFGMPST
jgi:hypothetical protein